MGNARGWSTARVHVDTCWLQTASKNYAGNSGRSGVMHPIEVFDATLLRMVPLSDGSGCMIRVETSGEGTRVSRVQPPLLAPPRVLRRMVNIVMCAQEGYSRAMAWSVLVRDCTCGRMASSATYVVRTEVEPAIIATLEISITWNMGIGPKWATSPLGLRYR